MLLASLNKSNVTKQRQPAATGPKDKLPPNIFYADVAQLNVYKKDLHKHSTCVKHQRWLQKYNCLINLFFIEFPYDDKADFWLYTRENWSSTTPTPPPSPPPPSDGWWCKNLRSQSTLCTCSHCVRVCDSIKPLRTGYCTKGEAHIRTIIVHLDTTMMLLFYLIASLFSLPWSSPPPWPSWNVVPKENYPGTSFLFSAKHAN